MSVTSMEANCGQVGMRSPQGWVRSTMRTRCAIESDAIHAAYILNDAFACSRPGGVRAARVARSRPAAVDGGRARADDWQRRVPGRSLAATPRRAGGERDELRSAWRPRSAGPGRAAHHL